MNVGILLPVITLAVALFFTLALALYLLTTMRALRDATKYLDQFTDGLARIERETESLNKNMSALQEGHARLLSTLQAADEHLTQTARLCAVEEQQSLEPALVNRDS